jgi:hypothetical protein
MRYGLFASLMIAMFAVGGCNCCQYATNFWWDTRLVPATASETVSGTGATEYTVAAPMVPHEMH